ncbi:bifunctional diguanylate cyclase/phosphodiesterase [Selenomonas sp. GACV-9]|uniref:putative bifunctional diguanylate cyclase/phosphodiesterase n=1 Tax=Selenomonas sp. GACV-9 TaxID=3158782 RepID=UPI00094DBC57
MKEFIRKNQKDEVTGLFNMMYFMEDAHYLLCDAADGNLAFLYFDIENFKEYNLKYGFQGGNKFLRRVAGILQDTFPDGILARLNDDHFMAAVKNQNIEQRMEYVRKSVYDFDQNMAMEIKVGLYVPAAGIQDIALILDRAKLACESVKGIYDKGWGVFDASFEEKLRLKNYIVSNFYRALEHHDIEIWYQPEIRTMTRQVIGFEALARWNSPEHGMIPPNIFIDVLESAHLIHKLDLYVIREVCEDFRRVREHGQGWQEARISVNLSRLDFQLTDIFANVEHIRQEYKVGCDRLRLEVTESALTMDDSNLMEQIARFRAAGYEVWMDDFGSGYSSLNTLKEYDFDMIKLDMRFLRDFGTNRKSGIIIQSLVDMAKKIGMHTLAEGVETEEQYEFLKLIGCEACQGYLFGKPQPLAPAANAYAKQGATLTFEPLKSSEYYQQVSGINVLSSFPLRREEESAGCISQLPLAIVEQGLSRDTFRYLYANHSYFDYLKSIGMDTLEAVVTRYQSGQEHMDRMMERLLVRCCQSGEEESADFSINGNLGTVRCRHIATDPVRDVHAYVVAPANLSAQRPHEGIDMHAAFWHIMGIFTRIDFLSSTGRAENIYIDETQNRITTEDESVRGSLELYAERYIVPEERGAFLQFYDLKDLAKRREQVKRDHFTAFFHSRNDAGEVRLKIYLLIPFQLGGVDCCLSCVRDMDGVSTLEQVRTGEVMD